MLTRRAFHAAATKGGGGGTKPATAAHGTDRSADSQTISAAVLGAAEAAAGLLPGAAPLVIGEPIADLVYAADRTAVDTVVLAARNATFE